MMLMLIPCRLAASAAHDPTRQLGAGNPSRIGSRTGAGTSAGLAPPIDHSAFADNRVPPDIIVLAVHWYTGGWRSRR
jgi:hypothetical protein